HAPLIRHPRAQLVQIIAPFVNRVCAWKIWAVVCAVRQRANFCEEWRQDIRAIAGRRKNRNRWNNRNGICSASWRRICRRRGSRRRDSRGGAEEGREQSARIQVVAEAP